MNRISVLLEKDGVKLAPESNEAKTLCQRLLAALLPQNGEEREVFDLDVRGGCLLIASDQNRERLRVEVSPSVAERLSSLLSGCRSIGVESSRNDDGSFRLYSF